MEARDAQRLVPRGSATALLTIALAAFYWLRYRDALLTFFALDDFWVMRDAAAITLHDWRDVGLFFRPSHNGFLLYRPLTTVGYAFGLHGLFGYDASAYHAVQLGVHLVNALLVGAIVRRLTGEVLAAGSGALLYAAMPGHASSLYWMSTFTMSGTALIVFTTVWAWLVLRGPLRATMCTLLQALGLLASEHAVSTPLLLAVASGSNWRRDKRALAGPAVCAVLYMLGKGYYFALRRRLVPGEGYAPDLNPLAWIAPLGRFTSAMHESLFTLPLGSKAHVAVGALVLAVTTFAAWRRGKDDAWSTVAVGGLMLLIGLLPVLPLVRHQFDYFIGIAGLGGALLSIGGVRLVAGRLWKAVAMTLAVVTCGWSLVHARAMPLANREVAQIRAVAELSARWVWTVDQAARAGVDAVAVPRHGLTDLVFALGQAERLFSVRPVHLSLYSVPPAPRPGEVILAEPPAVIPAADPLPGWRPEWDWLRDLAR